MYVYFANSSVYVYISYMYSSAYAYAIIHIHLMSLYTIAYCIHWDMTDDYKAQTERVCCI